MTNSYQAVQWNHHKRLYDLCIVAFVVFFVTGFVVLGRVFFPPPGDISLPVLLIRALGICAVLMLHIILIIGPLARISPRFSPLLYNRRHLGVSFFIVALMHAVLVIGFYGGFGTRNPITAVLLHESDTVPFELLGFLALVIFALMAATSHDFWLANLGPSFWKFVHMGVYVAYTLVIAHVVFGSLQSENNSIPLMLISLGALIVGSLHIFTGWREVQFDHGVQHHALVRDDAATWVDVCSVDDIKPERAHITQISSSERIAVFRNGNTVSAMTNVCPHQGGPLGEGKIVDGCVTCPWHGYQFKPDDGQSPPPFTEKIATYDIRVEGRRVLINPKPNEAGTRVPPASFEPWREGSV
ncbi:MAG: (2Fe-2S)-binding protein [Phycisphaerae bacterium]|nr:(2Fe-2S)-binding protein [Phycisphaerae bacterium]MBM91425.1 (2Fe-2S)-binding protein [Phycisphaerae bacterium]MBM92707.1 (2Fe-2S)-binding protein [Phycisphaerae bacterium]HCT44629.1 (2Fe-2S)-binding protein [Phycisphaerales bacterium]|tara:strand:- start:66 stop:1133 length:1068 start_codon:yes stop_codon:yes gene_type:complete